jgi:hypothetical protein
MKNFKQIDNWISTLLMVAALLTSLIRRDESFILWYFIVGAWQIISMLTHVYTGMVPKHSARAIYHSIVVVTLILAIIGVLVHYILYAVLMILLFAAPFMAIYYTILGFDESKKWYTRPLSILK